MNSYRVIVTFCGDYREEKGACWRYQAFFLDPEAPEGENPFVLIGTGLESYREGAMLAGYGVIARHRRERKGDAK